MARNIDTKQFILAGPHHGIEISGAEDLSSFLFELIPQWPHSPQGHMGPVAQANSPPDQTPIIIENSNGQWRITSPHMALSDYDLEDGYMVANALIGALIAAYVAQDDNLVSVHAGAVRVGDGLVLLLGANGSGKSTFATLLAAMGQRFFADDRLILDLSLDPSKNGPIGRSLAIAPKVRLPLPHEATMAYRDFVDENSVLVWPEMAVLRPSPDLAANFGEALPVRALIHLDRDDGVDQPDLAVMRQPHMVRILLEQLFAPHLNQQRELAACVKLAGSVGLWQLRYNSAFSAANILLSHFDDGVDG